MKATGIGDRLRLASPRVLAAGNRWGPFPAVEAMILGRPDPASSDDARLARIDGRLAAAWARPAPLRVVADTAGHAVVVRLAQALLGLLSPATIRGAVDGGRPPAVLMLECLEPRATLDALHLAVAIAGAPADGEAGLGPMVARFQRAYARALPGTDEWALARAVAARGIAWRRVEQGPELSHLVVGEGRHRRRLLGTVSDRTSHFAATVAERKDQCTRLLARHLFPVPRQRLVRDAEAAVAAAAAIGFPVVVKPIDRSGGVGVAVGLAGPAEVADAFAAARRHARGVVVESMLLGGDHRLLVIGGRLVAASRRTPAQVVGDGRRTVAELVAATNADPRRSEPGGLLQPIVLDGEAARLLAARGLTAASVPAAGEAVPLRSAGNRSQGGTVEDVTARVHPDNAALACQATRLLGLDVAGVDLIVPDIARSCLGTGGGICEINRYPSLLTHLAAPGAPDVVAAYLDHALEGGGRRRIPIAVVVGGDAADAVADAVGGTLEAQGLGVGVAAGGLVAAGLPLADPGRGDPGRVARLIDDPMVGALVVAVDARDLLVRGLGHRRCDFAVAVADEAPEGAAAPALRRMARLGAATAAFAGPDARRDAAAWLAARIAAAAGPLAPAGAVGDRGG
ncbi:MAG: hypothetical protein IT561_13500 [Alphaproteobacteria bacterium]|nr:hypothetical protein [Alphaproteobacteria bacterium]